MNKESVNSPYVLRYIYAMLTVIVIAATVAMGSLYLAQRDESMSRDRIESFHIDSYSESQRLAREGDTLHAVIEDALSSEATDRSGAAGISNVQIGYSGTLQSMRSRLTHLSSLQEQFDGVIFAMALERLIARFEQIDRTLNGAELGTEAITSVKVLCANIEQFGRLHTIAADAEQRGLAARQDQRPRFLAVVAVCLGFSALAVGYLINSLQMSLTRQKETEIALAEANDRLQTVQRLDALGRLVGGVAHDFNNLLTAILGNAELLQDKSNGDEALETGLQEIRTAGARAAQLTQQLLAFSRQQQAKRSVLDLNELIRGMVAVLQRTAGADVKLTCDFARDLSAIEFDQGQLQQVMLNLITNARDAMPNGGVLSVSTEDVAVSEKTDGIPGGDYVRLSVSDDGVGMDDYTRKRIFEPFFTTKEDGRGTGLGLSTVHGVVADSGGHITVESRQGLGTSFHIYFPRAVVPPDMASVEHVSIRPETGSETILVVDDDKQVLRFVDKGLSSLGYRVLTASGGAAGLNICERERGSINAIVSDVVMSGINGPRFMAGALRLCPGAVAIYMSAYTRDVLLWQRTGRDEIPVLSKPFELEALTRLIREGLDRFDDNKTSSRES